MSWQQVDSPFSRQDLCCLVEEGSLCDLVYLPLYRVILGRCNQSLSKLEEIGNFKMWVVARRSPNTDLAGMLTDAIGAVNVQNHILQKKRRNTDTQDITGTLKLKHLLYTSVNLVVGRPQRGEVDIPYWGSQCCWLGTTGAGLQTWIFQCNQHNNTC